MIAFGDRFYWVSRRMGFADNSALARHLGIPRPRVQGLLGLIFPPQAKTLKALADGLGVPVEALLVGVRTTSAPRPEDPGIDAALAHGHPPQVERQRKTAG